MSKDRRAYHVAWRLKNAYQIKCYKIKNANRIKIQKYEYRFKNRDKYLKQKKQYREIHKEAIKLYRINNKVRLREKSYQWRKNNRALFRAIRKRWREGMADGYIKKILGLHGKIDSNFLELKRTHLKLKHKLKEIML